MNGLVRSRRSDWPNFQFDTGLGHWYEDLRIDLTHRLGDLENKILNLQNYVTPSEQIIRQLEALID